MEEEKNIFFGREIPKVEHVKKGKIVLKENNELEVGDLVKLKNGIKLDLQKDLIGQIVEIKNNKYSVDFENKKGITKRINNLKRNQIQKVKTNWINF